MIIIWKISNELVNSFRGVAPNWIGENINDIGIVTSLEVSGHDDGADTDIYYGYFFDDDKHNFIVCMLETNVDDEIIVYVNSSVTIFIDNDVYAEDVFVGL